MTRRRCRPLMSLGVAVCLMFFHAAITAESSPAQTQAESQLQQLKTKIAHLKTQLEEARDSYSAEQKVLEKTDIEIQANALKLRKLEASNDEKELTLLRLQEEQRDYLNSLGQRRDMLASQIMAAYRLGRESRLKLVLNQDSPALLSRTLAYYDYFSRSQTSQIRELKRVLEKLDTMQSKINDELVTLNEIQNSLQALITQMQSQRSKRQSIVDGLAARISGDENRLAELQQNRIDLEDLLKGLSDVLADIPPDLGQRISPNDLKGKLPPPLKGRVKKAFGQRRSAGLRWQGWLIDGEANNDVKVIAHGRVAFSDWLRGYGLLIIIDHGDGFMSLYGNNESLLHGVGDWVEPGTAISTINPDSTNGLYFEIRRQGKAVDPATWLAPR